MYPRNMNHVGLTVTDIEEAVGCPSDWEQVGEVGADIGGDGLGRSNEIKKISEYC